MSEKREIVINRNKFFRKREIILRRREKQLAALRDLRGTGCTNSCRDLLVLAAYSTFVPLYGKEKAHAMAEEFNASFSDPLPAWELSGILYRTDCKEKVDKRGYYDFRSGTLVSFLHVTLEEAAAVGLMSKRDLAKAETAARRQTKADRVRELLTAEDRLTYREIAETMTAEGIRISERTVRRLAKDLGLTRYRKAAEETAGTETAKNCTRSYSKANNTECISSLPAGSETPNTGDEKKKQPGIRRCRLRDERFDVIRGCEEFKIADPAVVRLLEVAFFDAGNLRRDSFLVNGRTVPTAEIRAAFDSMTYKQIFTLARRMEAVKTVYTAGKPFFYVLQAVWKTVHPEDAAKTGDDRIRAAKRGESLSRHTDYNALVLAELLEDLERIS